jgi:transcriptional regulator with XRE-family HTH domain
MAFDTAPAEVKTRIEQLAGRIRIARQRRGWTVAETATRAGINRNTLTALEHGQPGVSISAYVATLWVLGLDRSLEAVADPDQDMHGKTLEAARRPERVRKRATQKDDYDF